jgi:hypothetical protein
MAFRGNEEEPDFSARERGCAVFMATEPRELGTV